jgi:hypothetical protein
MTYPSGLIRDEAAAVAQGFGVALDQVHRDHLISSILAALQAHADDLIFFGGTALARTYLTAGRPGEDIDLIAVTDRRSVARAISRTIDRALRVTHGRVDWTVALADIRDTEPASLVTADGLIVRIQLLRAGVPAVADRRARHPPALQRHRAGPSAHTFSRLVRRMEDRRVVRAPRATRPVRPMGAGPGWRVDEFGHGCSRRTRALECRRTTCSRQHRPRRCSNCSPPAGSRSTNRPGATVPFSVLLRQGGAVP